MPSSIKVVGANAVGKTSFVLALSSRKAVSAVHLPQHHMDTQSLWSRDPEERTVVRILRSQVQTPQRDSGIFVLVFDLTRRDTLTAVIAQWAYVSDFPGQKLLLVGTHADCTSKREVSKAELRELSGDFHAFEEVCCRPGHSDDKGMLRVQRILTQWTTRESAAMENALPLARASICGGFPRPLVTMMMPATTSPVTTSPNSRLSLDSQQSPRLHANGGPYDQTEESFSSPSASNVGGDVKLRMISKAIYDIRGAVAEKSKVLAKYRDRQMSHWLTRSRYFGPTESGRHKRWQAEQRKRQHSTQSHVLKGPHSGYMQHDALHDQRERSVSHPNKVERRTRKSSVRRVSTHYSSPSSSGSERSPGTPLERKSFMLPSELIKQRQKQFEEDAPQEKIKCLAAERTLRKQRRAASNDVFERSSLPSVGLDSYLNCYDEMDMPLQLKPSSPSLDRRTTPLRHSSVAYSMNRKSFTIRDLQAFKTDVLIPAGDEQSSKLLTVGAEPGSRPTLKRTVPSTVRSYRCLNDGNTKYDFLPDAVPKLTNLTKPCEDLKCASSPFTTAENGSVAKSSLPSVTPRYQSAGSRSNTICSSSSENFDGCYVDDMAEYFEGMTLPN
ncbi:hypothetical protein PsorP6_000213 [Peronosclerospora sorghi]|uniref:Uncharacterized protein n=1 Tax=Peronosclerospora sorghi TaxID=230839 RepID=A0ACC0WPX5_9STRA|nr:hypothetical protein PsorP6_000213 [Peronosclerospora sorghi]